MVIVACSCAGRLPRLAIPPKQTDNRFRSLESSFGPADLLWMCHDLLDHIAEVFRTVMVLAPVQVDYFLSCSSQPCVRLSERKQRSRATWN